MHSAGRAITLPLAAAGCSACLQVVVIEQTETPEMLAARNEERRRQGLQKARRGRRLWAVAADLAGQPAEKLCVRQGRLNCAVMLNCLPARPCPLAPYGDDTAGRRRAPREGGGAHPGHPD